MRIHYQRKREFIINVNESSLLT